MKVLPKVLGVTLFIIGVFWFITIIVARETKSALWNNLFLISGLTAMVGLILGGKFLWWKDQKMTGIEFLIVLVICLIMVMTYLDGFLLY